ncbi:class I SAM-dependent methyltransferase [Peribacillus sp. JNUCC 23]
MLMLKKNIEYINDYLLQGHKNEDTPPWLNYLIDAEEIHQNYENITSIKELSTHSVIKYVQRTLQILEELKSPFLSEEMYWQLATVLSYCEVAKGGTAEQRNKWVEKGYNIFVHNEGSADIFLHDYTGYDKPLLYELIKTHGLLGQCLRGESRLITHRGLVKVFKNYYSTMEAKKMLLHLNHCVIGGVSNELWLKLQGDIEASIDRMFHKQDNQDEFESRVDKLTSSFQETYQEKMELIDGQGSDKVKMFLADKDLWYVEPSMHDFSFVDFWTILVMASEDLKKFSVRHINFEKLMQQLHYDYQGAKHNNIYRKRIIEKYLNEFRINRRPDTTHVNFNIEINESLQIAFVSFEFSAVGESLIQFCVEAEKVDMMHSRATVLLFDFFGLRRDAYDRFHNESTYLAHMNSAADDKRIILDYIKGDTILDVGPGGGVLLDMLEKETVNKEIIGIDLSENVIESLKKKKKEKAHSWDVIKGDALKLIDIFKPNTLDTIIYSSILHELFSYVEYEGKKFNHDVIKQALNSAFTVLKPGGRIIIRDGIMTESKNLSRIIRFKDGNGMKFLQQYAKDFQGREMNYQVLAKDTVKMKINDSMEFLYTYTWGEDSYAHEVQEQFGYFTPEEYKNFVHGLFGNKVKIIQFKHYLQGGYPSNLHSKIDYEDEDGNSVTLPDSTCLMVIEKV